MHPEIQRALRLPPLAKASVCFVLFRAGRGIRLDAFPRFAPISNFAGHSSRDSIAMLLCWLDAHKPIATLRRPMLRPESFAIPFVLASSVHAFPMRGILPDAPALHPTYPQLAQPPQSTRRHSLAYYARPPIERSSQRPLPPISDTVDAPRLATVPNIYEHPFPLAICPRPAFRRSIHPVGRTGPQQNVEQGDGHQHP